MTNASHTQSGFADVNGAKLYYEVAGAGHPLVLLHAGVADNTLWDDQFDLFAQSYRVVRYDQRGFGQSEMPPGPFAFYKDLAGLLDFLGIEKAHVCGVSMGGRTVIDFALAYPDRVAALIPVAAGLSGTPPDESAKPLYAPLEEAYEAQDLDRVLDLESDLWLVGPRRTRDAVSPALHEHFRKMERHNLEREFSGPEEGTPENLDPPAYDRLGEIHAPTLVIIGDADLPNTIATAARLAANIVGARKVVLPDTAHLVPMERPTEFNRIVLDFLPNVV
ncbi:MAG: alpha/beta fold hydrolase [Chloroflexia bacterium]